MSAGAKKKAPAATGAGRPRFDAEVMQTASFRCTPEQKAKLERLGGAVWIRKKIELAKDPAE